MYTKTEEQNISLLTLLFLSHAQNWFVLLMLIAPSSAEFPALSQLFPSTLTLYRDLVFVGFANAHARCADTFRVVSGTHCLLTHITGGTFSVSFSLSLNRWRVVLRGNPTLAESSARLRPAQRRSGIWPSGSWRPRSSVPAIGTVPADGFGTVSPARRSCPDRRRSPTRFRSRSRR